MMRDRLGNPATNDTATVRLTSSNPASQPLNKLTPRERQVLGLMAQGKTNKEIAAVLVTSQGTVKTHVAHIFRKLGVSDRIGAVLAALGIDPSKLLPAA
jgi:DNA-binding NarL/FixJ family response regulator